MTAEKEAADKLKQTVAELERTNADLAKFNRMAVGREIFAASKARPDGDRRSLLVDGLHLIHCPRIEQLELFDLQRDWSERQNLVANDRYRDRLSDLGARLQQTVANDRLSLSAPLTEQEPSKKELTRLRSLGYVR